jgi:hypothetical protein
MRIIVSVLAFFVVAAPPMLGQAAGDSIRLRIPPSSVWTHGRFVSLDSGQLMVSQAERDQSYPLQSIGRLEVRRRKNAVATVVGATLGCAAGAALAGLIRPDNRRPLFGSDGANIAVAAGVGLAVGLIDISVSPWHWKRVRVGLKAAT